MELEILKFTGEHCPGCKVLSGHLKDTDTTKFVIIEYNIDSEEGMNKAQEHMVMSVPVLIRLEEGVEVDRMNGFNLPDFRRIFR